MSKDPTTKVSLTYRLSEDLRSRLEAASEKADRSLNSEISHRLEWTFNNNSFYGRETVSTMAHLIGLAVKLSEDKWGAWHTSEEAATACRQAAFAVLDVFIKAPGHERGDYTEEELENKPLIDGETAALQVLMDEGHRTTALDASPQPGETGKPSRRRCAP